MTVTSWYGECTCAALCNHGPPSAKAVVSNALCFSSSPVFMTPQVPNLPGIITSLIRFFLFWKFGSANQLSPSYKPLRIWGGRKNLSTGWPEGHGYLEWNTLPPNNRCWESTLVFCCHAFQGSKWTFLLCILLETSVLASVASCFFVSHQLPFRKDPHSRSNVSGLPANGWGHSKVNWGFPLDLYIPYISQRICGDQGDSPVMKNAVNINIYFKYVPW